MPANTQYLVAALGDSVIVSIHGRAVYTTCREFGEFLDKIAKNDAVKRLILDMKSCDGVDSTVLGLIAGASGDLKARGADLILQRCNERIAEVVVNLGLCALLTFIPGEQVAAGTEAILADGVASSEGASPATNHTILQAHETLMEANPENVARFKQVVDFMRADLGI